MGTTPAAGDAGDAWGAALAAYHLHNSGSRTVPQSGDAMQGSYLDPSYDGDDVAKRLEAAGAKIETLTKEKMIDITSQALADGKAIGWFQGRMEFGPSALGG